MVCEILLFLILVVLIIQTYLLYKLLPKETQKEVMRKIDKPEGEVYEWTPPKSETEKAFDETLEKIRK